jgi:hypothetical protein
VVDVPDSSGKEHRFDVVSNTQSTPVALAAAEVGEKQRWLAIMETKQAREKRMVAAAIGAGTLAVHTTGVSGGSSRCK